MKTCSYGCGQEAHYTLKNGKPCCSPFAASCPTVRENIREGIKRKLKEGTWQKGRGGWNKGLTKENSNKIKERGQLLHQRYMNGELTPSFKGKKHSAETKQKISISRKKFLQENPSQVPYLLNHYSKGPSYPEMYWIDLIKREKLNLSYHKQVGLYELDFFNESKMIDLEIDGEQHYTDTRIIASDIQRTAYLESLGWKVLRIRWNEWQKLAFQEKHNFVEELRKMLQ